MNEALGGIGAIGYLLIAIVAVAISLAPLFIWRHAAEINRKMDKLETTLTHLSVEIRKLRQPKSPD